jgi:hypothetical protein
MLVELVIAADFSSKVPEAASGRSDLLRGRCLEASPAPGRQHGGNAHTRLFAHMLTTSTPKRLAGAVERGPRCTHPVLSTPPWSQRLDLTPPQPGRTGWVQIPLPTRCGDEGGCEAAARSPRRSQAETSRTRRVARRPHPGVVIRAHQNRPQWVKHASGFKNTARLGGKDRPARPSEACFAFAPCS